MPMDVDIIRARKIQRFNLAVFFPVPETGQPPFERRSAVRRHRPGQLAEPVQPVCRLTPAGSTTILMLSEFPGLLVLGAHSLSFAQQVGGHTHPRRIEARSTSSVPHTYIHTYTHVFIYMYTVTRHNSGVIAQLGRTHTTDDFAGPNIKKKMY